MAIFLFKRKAVTTIELTHMKNILLIPFVFFLSLAARAQEGEAEDEPKKGFQKENLFIGGNFGLSFGDYTLINVSPQLGYRFNRFFAAGFGVNGQYVSYRDIDSNGDHFKTKQGIIGLNMFGRVYPINQIMLQIQPEANYRFGKNVYYRDNPVQEFKTDAMIVPSMLLGGGAVLQQGRGAMIISVMYDVLQRDYSPYGRKPVYNFGYNINLY